MKLIKTKLVHDIQKDHHAASNSNSKAEYIDERKSLALFQITPGYFQIILYHNDSLVIEDLTHMKNPGNKISATKRMPLC